MWNIQRFEQIDSTNSALKRQRDASHGTVYVAKRQSSGRGRMGRSFVSPHGIYYSVLLRRSEPPTSLMHLTAMVAVAVRRALSKAADIQTDIKWVNDLLLGQKKLCGILVESEGDRYIIGIGINCNTDPDDLPEDVRQMAAVISCDEELLICELTRQLQDMDRCLLSHQKEWMQEYAAACVNIGKPVQILHGEERQQAVAVGVDENAALLVQESDGSIRSISSGEVSVRGLYGYI